MISQTAFNDLLEFFLIVFGPIVQWELVGLVAAIVFLCVLVIGLALLRRFVIARFM